MAKLNDTTFTGKWEQQDGEDFRAYIGRTEAMFQELEEASSRIDLDGSLKGALVSFPIADGHANYIVTKDRPLTLAHVPFGDAWQIPAAHLRGLTAADIRLQLNQHRRIAELFTKKK